MTRPNYRGASNLDTAIDELRLDVTALQEAVSGETPSDLIEKVSSLTDSVSGISDTVSGLAGDVQDVTDSVQSLQAQVDAIPSPSEITADVEQNVSGLTATVSAHTQTLGDLSTSMEEADTAIGDLQGKTQELFHRKGDWDASTGKYPLAPKEGDTYRISVAGVPFREYTLSLDGWQGTGVPLSDTPRTNYFWPSTATSRRTINGVAQTTFTSGSLPDPLGGNTASRIVAAQDGVTGFGPYWAATTQTSLPPNARYLFKLAMRAVNNPLQVTFRHSNDPTSTTIADLTNDWQVFTCSAFYSGTGLLSAYLRDTVNTGEGFDFAFVGAYDSDGTYISTVGAPASRVDYTAAADGEITLQDVLKAGEQVKAVSVLDGYPTPTLVFTGNGIATSFLLPATHYDVGEAIVYTGVKWDFLVTFQEVEGRLAAIEDEVSGLQSPGSGYATQDDVANVSVRVDAVSGDVQALSSQVNDLQNKLGTYKFNQVEPAATWTINHGLGKRPSVVVVDSAGNLLMCAIGYIDDNNLEVRSAFPFSGEAYLN